MARKLLLLGAAVVAAGIFLKRDKVAGLLPSRSPEPYVPPAFVEPPVLVEPPLLLSPPALLLPPLLPDPPEAFEHEHAA